MWLGLHRNGDGISAVASRSHVVAHDPKRLRETLSRVQKFLQPH